MTTKLEDTPMTAAEQAKATEMEARFLETFTVVDDDDPRLTATEAPELAEKLKKAGYPARHIKRQLEGLSGPSHAKARELWPMVQSGDAMILLLGSRGPGKTQMATAWAAGRIKSGKSAGQYVKCADLITEIKATWGSGRRGNSEQDVLQKFQKTSYLVIDEFHEKGASDWEARVLVNIFDHRYDSMLVTVIIANMTEEEAEKQINPSIKSRAQETGGLILCDWPSYRQNPQMKPTTQKPQ